MNKKIIIWGSGKIGRGFIADIFNDEGYQVCLIDESPELIDALKKQKNYTVIYAGKNSIIEKKIENYSAFNTNQAEEIAEEFLNSDLLAISVFPQDLESTANQIKKYILNKKIKDSNNAFNIILCTNLIHAGPKFEKFLQKNLSSEEKEYFKKNVGIIESLVIRMAPTPPKEALDKDPLVVWTNGYNELPVDETAFKGTIPDIKSLRLVKDMRSEEIRKIYTYNMCHAVIAYHGYFKKYYLLVDCLNDTEIKKEAVGVLSEISSALQKEFGFTREEMNKWINNVLEHTDNPSIGDTVLRSAADPVRKLQKEDRLIGPALLCLKNNIYPEYLIKGIAAALHFYNDNDQGSIKIQEMIDKTGIRETIKEVCSLTEKESQFIDDIVKAYNSF